MTLDPFAVRLRRALRRPPGYFVKRLADSVVRRSRRPWSRLLPVLLTDAAVLRELNAATIDDAWSRLAAQPFFVQAADRAATALAFTRRYPDGAAQVVGAADAILRHEFNLLGSGVRSLGERLPWHEDFKTGRCWPLQYSSDIEYLELDRSSDVKVPWELSRCQHFTALGQAYWLTGDDRYAQEFVREVGDWTSANPYVQGVNWACAMDVALRAVSWIWAFHYLAEAPACADAAFRASFLRTLVLHGEFVASHLERGDVNGNHYLCDGVGLVFLGCFFAPSRRAARWRRVGRSIVEGEIFLQTTPDGVDFEQSTAYHRLVLEAFLTAYELLRITGEAVPDACTARLQRMCEFVEAYTKPDGRAPLVGDADDGRIQILGGQPLNDHRYLLSTAAVIFQRGDFKAAAGRCWEETFWLSGAAAPERFDRLEVADAAPQSIAFPEGGFYVLRTAGTHVFVDCGEVGMRGRGGHGHNDMLGFELFLDGANLISDCGAFVYTASRDWRNKFRSTAFHNTVQVDGEELNRFVGADALWQLHYDAVPTSSAIVRGAGADRFVGGHQGYERLPEPVTVTRELLLDRRTPRVAVCDTLTGRGVHDLVWRFHLDPDASAEQSGVDVRLSSGTRTAWLLPDTTASAFDVMLEPGWVSASYGTRRPTTVIVWRARAALPISAGGLFAESRLSVAERAEVVADLRSRSMKAQ